MFRNKENSHYRHVSRNASFLRVFLLSLCRIELILQVPSNLTKVFYTKQTKYFLHTHASKEYSLQKLRRLSSSLLQAFFFPFPYSFSVRSTQHATIPKARFSANRLRRVREIDRLSCSREVEVLRERTNSPSSTNRRLLQLLQRPCLQPAVRAGRWTEKPNSR